MRVWNQVAAQTPKKKKQKNKKQKPKHGVQDQIDLFKRLHSQLWFRDSIIGCDKYVSGSLMLIVFNTGGKKGTAAIGPDYGFI